MDRLKENGERACWQKLCQHLSEKKKILTIIFIYLPILVCCVVCLYYLNQVKEESPRQTLSVCLSFILVLVCFRIIYICAIFWARFRENGNYGSCLRRSNLSLGSRINYVDEVEAIQYEHELPNRIQGFFNFFHDPPNYYRGTGNPSNCDMATGNPPNCDMETGNPPNYDMATGNPPNYDMATGNPPNYDMATAN